MMDVEALFNDLESNNPQTNEEAKKKLAEFFNLTKDPGLVKDMMEYYLRTNSARIIDVLIKVQHPHDNFVFDRLADWLKSQQCRTASLSLFGYIVRKHPTWLHKVAKHRLIRDIFKLLQNEKEVVPLMSALLCIITLLPIIHSSTQQFLPELFEVFGHLASWNCQNPNHLRDDQLIHLQIGLHMLFYRLYGMYPWHFTIYLKEFIKEKGAIFHHTIKPLLETVRIHPLLITGTKESEAHVSRWKDMEPHDVVVECAKLSLAVYNQDNNPDWFAIRCQDTPYSNKHQQQQHNSFIGDTPFKPIRGFSSPFHTLMQRERLMDYQKFDQIWSPQIEILATPPPTSTVPHTPTPNYGVPLITSGSNLLGGTGSSPPEAAVEATPETTPMKDLNLKRGLLSNKPHAVRSILVSSQPSSPMRKEQSPFNFSENLQNNLAPMSLSHSQTYCQNILDQSATTTATTTTVITNSSITTTNQRFMQMVTDRNQAQLIPSNCSEINSNVSKLQPLMLRDIQQVCGLKNVGQLSLESPTYQSENTREDQEVTELTSQQLGIVGSSVGGPHHSDTLQDISNECDDDCDEAERSPCSIGGLHVPTNRTMQLFVNRIKRNRLATYCQNDTSSYLSYGTSPADTTANEMFHVSYIVKAKVRRTNSWPVIDRKLCIDEPSVDSEMTTEQQQNNNTSIPTQQNGDSSSPSGDDVMSAATHFKKIQQKKYRKHANTTNVAGASNISENRKISKNDMINFAIQNVFGSGEKIVRNNNIVGMIPSNFNRIRNNITTKTSSTQTIEQWPHIYEFNLLELFVEDNKLRNVNEKTTLEPHEILNEYIDLTIKAKYSTELKNREEEFKEQIQLLYLHLQYERHRREIHAERNRRLMGRSREKRGLELENERLGDQLRNIEEQNNKLIIELEAARKSFKDKEIKSNKELNIWKSKYQSELDDKNQLKFTNESIQRQLSDEIKNRQQANLKLDILNGEIFDLRNELQHTQYQAELGQQYKQDLIKLETEFMVMGEVQVKCRDRLNEIENLKARDEELKIRQAASKNEINELRSSLEDKTAHLDRAKYRLNELQTQLANKEMLFTDQKRLLKSVKDEYEEKVKALDKKYEAQKAIISQMEQKILELYKNRTTVNLALSPESERTDMASSVDRTSPLSTSLASSGDGLSASLRSVTELCNLQAIVNTPSYKSNDHPSSLSKYTSIASSSAAKVATVGNSSATIITSHHTTNLSSTVTASTSSNSGIIVTSGGSGSNRQTAGSVDIPLPGPSQQNHRYSAHHR